MLSMMVKVALWASSEQYCEVCSALASILPLSNITSPLLAFRMFHSVSLGKLSVRSNTVTGTEPSLTSLRHTPSSHVSSVQVLPSSQAALLPHTLTQTPDSHVSIVLGSESVSMVQSTSMHPPLGSRKASSESHPLLWRYSKAALALTTPYP